ncbi:MAG TPA: carboxypeptidase-like regulatory domain-containing protein [Nocardioides sp.]
MHPTAPVRRGRHLAAALVALLLVLTGAAVAVTGAGTTPRADAAASSAAAKGRLVGAIRVGGSLYGGSVKVTVFDMNWKVLGATTVRSTYQLSVAPGSYRIQVTDTRPIYDTNRFAPTDLTATVRSAQTIQRDASMRRGASITGTVRTNGAIGSGARVVAANPYGQSFETIANRQGQFAIGGLPTANYSIFTYDARGQWADSSTFLRNRKVGTNTNVGINLKRRAGSLVVNIVGGGQQIPGNGYVTARNKATGQWYVARASNGNVSFSGVMPGPYELVVPDMGNFLGRTGNLPGGRHVPAGNVLFSAFELVQRGGSVAGYVVDTRVQDRFLPGVQVQLYNKYGTLVGSTWSTPTGRFLIQGPLRTDTGYKIVLSRPNGGWITFGPGGNDTCQYGTFTSSAFSINVGQTRTVGNLPLTAIGHPQNPQCIPQTTSPTASPTTSPTTSPTASPTTSPTTPATSPTATATSTSTP